jgi:TAT (twin-arginine translocation) pathway signal sequence
MGEMKRRDFLKGGTAAMAAAGMIAAMPMMPALIGAMDTEGPEADSALAGGSDAGLTMAEPLVVRINDLESGAMQMFYGTQESTYNDPQLAARLFRASQ